MRISFECECVLLQKTLLLFCGDYVSSQKDCDFIVSDVKFKTQKPIFLISEKNSHLKIPFSKNKLINTLLEFYSAIQVQDEQKVYKTDKFEAKLDALLSKFRADLISLVKENR